MVLRKIVGQFTYNNKLLLLSKLQLCTPFYNAGHTRACKAKKGFAVYNYEKLSPAVTLHKIRSEA